MKGEHSMFKRLNKNQQGFTLIEIILVVVAISILAGIVILAINPSKQLGDTRNAQRQADVTTILNAVYQYSADNGGALPTSITSSAAEVCATDNTTCNTLVDLSPLTTNEKYLTAIPKDPSCTTSCAAGGTGYQIVKSTNNRVTVSAPAAEQGRTISATR